MTRRRLNDVISLRLPEDLRQKILNVSGGDISSFVRSAIEEKLAKTLASPEVLEERLNQLELELQKIDINLQARKTDLANLEKEFEARKTKLEIEIRELELQKSRLIREIEQIKNEIEEIRKKQEEEAKKLRLTDKAIRIVRAVFCAEEPANEEIAEIVNAVGRLNIRETLQKMDLINAKIAFGEKINELTEFIKPIFEDIHYDVVRGLALMFVEDTKLLKYSESHYKRYSAEARAWLIKNGAEEYALVP